MKCRILFKMQRIKKLRCICISKLYLKEYKLKLMQNNNVSINLILSEMFRYGHAVRSIEGTLSPDKEITKFCLSDFHAISSNATKNMAKCVEKIL